MKKLIALFLALLVSLPSGLLYVLADTASEDDQAQGTIIDSNGVEVDIGKDMSEGETIAEEQNNMPDSDEVGKYKPPVLDISEMQTGKVEKYESSSAITWSYDRSTSTLTISGTGDMDDYDYSDAAWYDDRWGDNVPPWYDVMRSVKKIVIEPGVTSIGDSAFCECPNLESVIIPDTVVYVGYSPFVKCPKLQYTVDENGYYLGNADNPYHAIVDYNGAESLTVNSRTKVICGGAFSSGSSTNWWLESVTIPDGVLSIGSGTFYECATIESITLPSSVTRIGEYAFNGCESLKKVNIPSKVTAIEYATFSGCSLTSISVPSNVTSIGDYAFYGCSFTSITIPSKVTSIGWGAFSHCDSLKSITIPSKVTSIGGEAFSNCTSLTSISIPSSVVSIGFWAFDGCDNLNYNTYNNAKYLGNSSNKYVVLISATSTSITSCSIKSGTKIIYDGAFGGCENLKNITIPASVVSIGDSAFYDCTSLASINIPSSVVSIGDYAFEGCYNTKVDIADIAAWCKVKLGYGVSSNPITNCTELYNNGKLITELVIPNGVTSIGDYAFYNAPITSVTLPSSVTTIGDYAFDCCDIEIINIPDGVTSIGVRAFSECWNLTSISIPDSMTSIGGEAFSNCTSLTSISIPDSVTSIGKNAFYGCNKLQFTIYDNGKYLGNSENPFFALVDTVSDSITYCNINLKAKIICGGAFSGCTALKSITIPNGTNIGGYAFYGCTALTGIAISSGTNIGYYAFSGCTGLKSITIPNGTNIGDYAFSGCTALTGVAISSGTNIGDYAFSGCTALKSITIPNGTSIGDYAFSRCKMLSDIVFTGDMPSIARYAFSGLVAFVEYNSENAGWPGINQQYNGAIGWIDTSKENDIAWVLDKSTGQLTIKGSGRMDDYSSESNAPWYSDRSSIKTVVISDGITSIGSYAFYWCDSIVSISIPNSVKEIGIYAFFGCYSITSLTLPFINEKLLSDVFGDTYKLTLIELAVKGGSISSGSFDFGRNLFTKIIIGSAVEYIDKDAFDELKLLEVIEVSESNKYYCSVDRMLYNKDKTELIHKPVKHSYIARIYCYYATKESPFNTFTKNFLAGEDCASLLPDIVGYSHRVEGVLPAKDVVIDVVYYENNRLAGGDCNNSIEWVVYNDGKLVLRGKGSMPDYTEGNAPWAEYADSIDALYIDSGVTSIGAYAFSGLQKLKYADMGYGVTRIGTYAFSGCAALGGIDIPDSVIYISSKAFYGCSSIETVRIGGAVTEIGGGAFAECDNLTQIYFAGEPPKAQSDSLGSQSEKFVYYYSNFTAWQNVITDGIWNGYKAIPYNAIASNGNFDGTNVYIIKAVDRYNTPLVGAKVYLGGYSGTTNKDGMAYFVKPTEPVKLKVTFDDHIDFVDDAFAASSQIMDIIEMSDKPSYVKGLRLNNKTIATSVEMVNCATNDNITITVSGYSKYQIIRYELMQGTRIITSKVQSEDTCTFTVKANMFKEGDTVFVRMYTSDDSMVASVLNIGVINMGVVSEKQIIGNLAETELGIDFGKLGQITIPVVGNPAFQKVTTYVEGNTMTVGINMDVAPLAEKKKSKIAFIKEVTEKIKGTLEQKKASKKTGVSIDVCGYIKVEYLGDGQYKISECYVKASVSASFSVGGNVSFYGLVGLNYSIKIGANGYVELLVSGFDNDNGLKVEDLDIGLGAEIKAELNVYILYGAGSGGVYGSLDAQIVFGIVPKFELESFVLSGELGLQWQLLWGVMSGTIPLAGPGVIYEWSNEDIGSGSGGGGTWSLRLYQAMKSPDSYQSNDRAYLELRSEWSGSATADGYIQKNIYYGVQPKIVTCAGAVYMFWLDDNGDRETSAYQTLYYSVYADGAWSKPIVVNDNGTFDCEFDVCTDGEKVYVVYTEMKSSNIDIDSLDLSDQSSIDAFVGGVEAHVIILKNGKFGTPVQLTNNDTCELMPRISVEGGRPAVRWLQTNAVGLSEDAVGSRIFTMVLEDYGWSKENEAATSNVSVLDITSVEMNGKTYTAYLVDSDGTGATTDDYALLICTADGEPMQVDVGSISNISSSVVRDQELLTWKNRGKVYMICSAEDEPVCLTPDEAFVDRDYEIVTVGSGKTMLTYVADNGEKSNIYGVFADKNGYVGGAVKLVDADGYIDGYSCFFADDTLTFVYRETSADIDGDNTNFVSHLRSSKAYFSTDILLDSIDYSIFDAKAGEDLELEMNIVNVGMTDVDAVIVNVYDSLDKLIYKTEASLDLASGVTSDCKVKVRLPESLSLDAYYVEIIPKVNGTALDDSDMQNNCAQFKAAFADMEVEAEQKIIGGRNYLLVTVKNFGNTASSARLGIYAPDQSGRLIAEIESTAPISAGNCEQFLVDIYALTSSADKVVTCVAFSSFEDPCSINDQEIVSLLHINTDGFAVAPEQTMRNPQLSANTAVYDKYTGGDVVVTITSDADIFVGIDGLTSPDGYTVGTNGNISIKSSYLRGLSEGTHTFDFIFNYGINEPMIRSVSITVTDSSPVVLSGSVGIDGDAVIGGVVEADISDILPVTASLTYTWTIDGVTVSTQSYFEITEGYSGKMLTLTVRGTEGYEGSFTAQTEITLRKPAAPATPIVIKVDATSITLIAVKGIEYSLDLVKWQNSGVFGGLRANTTYTIYARVAQTANNLAGDTINVTVKTTSCVEHVFDHDCDSDCNNCDYTRMTVHAISTSYYCDDTHHYFICTVEGCDAVFSREPHNYINEVCTKCGDSVYTSLVAEVANGSITILEGDSISSADISVFAIKANGMRVKLSDSAYTLSGYNINSPGEQTVTVKYLNLSCDFALKVTADIYKLDATGKNKYGLGYTISGTSAVLSSVDSTVLAVNVEIPEYVMKDGVRYSVIGISANAFAGISGMESITLPKTIKTIGNGAFTGCTSLKKVNITSLTSWCKTDFAHYSSNPVFYAKNIYVNDRLVTSVTIPVGITEVVPYAFVNCTSLTMVKLPVGITKISKYAFYGCSGLKEIVIPLGVAQIGSNAFRNCISLGRVCMPVTVDDISSDSFVGCDNIIIKAVTSSYAYDYALAYSIQTSKLGDLDLDNEYSNTDITIIIRYLSGYLLEIADAENADIDLDGSVNNRDAILLIRVLTDEENNTFEGYIAIRNQTQLESIRDNLDGKYYLTRDITLDGQWSPIGSNNAPFTGVLDGNGHTISGVNINITISTAAYVGLIGYNKGTVKNLTVDGSIAVTNSTEKSSIYTAGIVAYNLGTITNCTNKVKVTGRSSVWYVCSGGIAGFSGDNSVITDCVNNGSVRGYSPGTCYSGGIVGQAISATITGCSNYSNVQSDLYAGGIVGLVKSSNVKSCSNIGAVSAISTEVTSCAGGIAGVSGDLTYIELCYSTGIISAGSYAGGIVARNYGKIYNAYNTGAVSAATSISSCYAGGIVGHNESAGVLRRCLNVARIIGNSTYVNGLNYVGGIVGGEMGNTALCYYSSVMSVGAGKGTDNSVKIFSSQLKDESYYVGFDFASVWKMGESYPILK